MFDDLNPQPRLLMGPGPITADPRVLRAMSAQLLGQFDPQFRAYMSETMALYRQIFETRNHWTMLIDSTARGGIESAMVSLIEPGERVLVGVFGRFGQLKCEIARRCGAEVHTLETEWGTVFTPDDVKAAVKRHRPKLVALCQGDTSTTMAQPLAEIGRICHEHDAFLYVDATASILGMPLPVDAWEIDACTAGLQKCLGGPSGVAPITLGDRAAEAIYRRRHIEEGVRPPGFVPGPGPVIASNYFDLAMIMDYWGEMALNHHTEATTMLYGARECARIALQEGLPEIHRRHALASQALMAGLDAMGLRLFGDLAHKMPNVTGVRIPDGVDADRVRARMLEDFSIEIGTSFGPLQGKVWRIGTMGYNARKDAVLVTLGALDAVLAKEGFKLPRGAGVDAAGEVYLNAEVASGAK